MPEIIVIDLDHVTIDGELAGSIPDVVINHSHLTQTEGHIEGIGSLALRAAKSWHDGLMSSHAAALKANDDAHGKDRAAIHEQHRAALANGEAKAQAALAAKDAAILALHEEYQAALATHKQAADEATAALKVAKDEYKSRAQGLQDHIDALGGTEMAIELKRQARAAQLRETIEKQRAELATLEAPSGETAGG